MLSSEGLKGGKVDKLKLRAWHCKKETWHYFMFPDCLVENVESLELYDRWSVCTHINKEGEENYTLLGNVCKVVGDKK